LPDNERPLGLGPDPAAVDSVERQMADCLRQEDKLSAAISVLQQAVQRAFVIPLLTTISA
jgi:hypothetical protein